MAELLRHIFSHCFFNNDAHHFEHSGILLDLAEPGEQPQETRRFARHAYTFCDFMAIREVVSSMVPTALKPCPSCQNVVKDDVAESSRDLRKVRLRKECTWDECELQPLSSLQPHLWRRHSDESVRDMQAYLLEQQRNLATVLSNNLRPAWGSGSSHQASSAMQNTVVYPLSATIGFTLT